jgi:hypothetical protein
MAVNVTLNVPLLVFTDDIRSYSDTASEIQDEKRARLARIQNAEKLIKGRLSSGVAVLGKTREVMQGSEIRKIKDCAYVREWQLGEKSHRARKVPPPRLVNYFPRSRDGTYDLRVLALLCNSLSQAANVFERCGEKLPKCAWCGSPFKPKRTGKRKSTCCSDQHTTYNRIRKNRRAAQRTRRK